MTDFTEKHYSIDPGKGKKMDGCPYSSFEDGRDVKDYIIPPKGYVFAGFQFDPDARNQIYDGKLIAEYAKEPFKQRFKDNLWKFILAFAIILVVALIVVLAAGVFKKSDTPRPPKATKIVVQPKDTVEKKGKTATVNETPAVTTPVASQTQEAPAVIDSGKAEKPEQTVSQPVADDPNVQFKQEFWTLIHQRTITMDSYHDLYVNYKGKVEGEEYDYLRYTILKDFASYKVWYERLKKIPEKQLQSINTIDELNKRINE